MIPTEASLELLLKELADTYIKTNICVIIIAVSLIALIVLTFIIKKNSICDSVILVLRVLSILLTAGTAICLCSNVVYISKIKEPISLNQEINALTEQYTEADEEFTKTTNELLLALSEKGIVTEYGIEAIISTHPEILVQLQDKALYEKYLQLNTQIEDLNKQIETKTSEWTIKIIDSYKNDKRMLYLYKE